MHGAGAVACKLVNFLPVLCITVSVYTLVAMSYERCRAIVYHDRTQISIPTAKQLCITIWIISFIITIPTIVEYKVYHLEPDEKSGYDEDAGGDGGDGGVGGDAAAAAATTEGWGVSSAYTGPGPSVEKHRCGSQGANRTLVVLNGIFLFLVSYIMPMCIMLYNYGRLAHFVLGETKKVTSIYSHNLEQSSSCTTYACARAAVHSLLVMTQILYTAVVLVTRFSK